MRIESSSAAAVPEPLVGRSYAELLDAWIGTIAGFDEGERTDFRREQLGRRHGQPTNAFDVRLHDGRSLRAIDRLTAQGDTVKTIWDMTDDVRIAEEKQSPICFSPRFVEQRPGLALRAVGRGMSRKSAGLTFRPGPCRRNPNEGIFEMSYSKIGRSGWKDFFDVFTKAVERRMLELEIVGRDVGDQRHGVGLDLNGITYDPTDDARYVSISSAARSHLDHVVRLPTGHVAA